MKKRYQAVRISFSNYKYNWEYTVLIHDRLGKDGIFLERYTHTTRTAVIKALRADGVEVSKHVENGGSLRLV